MQTIPLFAVADQTFTTTLDNDRYVIRIFKTGETMSASVQRNETVATTGQRITPGEMLIPFPAYQGVSGNFILLTANEELPNFAQFGITQTLVYFSLAEELEILTS